MQVHTFPLNDSGSARLVVSVGNVPPVMARTPALIHAPGGGFMFCSESDTVTIGARCTAKGVGVVCTYLYPVGREYRFPQVVVDMMRSIKIVRDHAQEWGVDPDKIIISGNSAGAFICMSTGNLWNRPDLMEKAGCTGEEGKPNAMILGFGPMFCGQQEDEAKLTYVPNGELVGEQTPPAFFHHARMDTLVSVYQTIAMIDAMEGISGPSAASSPASAATARPAAASGWRAWTAPWVPAWTTGSRAAGTSSATCWASARSLSK